MVQYVIGLIGITYCTGVHVITVQSYHNFLQNVVIGISNVHVLLLHYYTSTLFNCSLTLNNFLCRLVSLKELSKMKQ